MQKEFERHGILVERIYFNENGHRLQLKIDADHAVGWEELDLIYLPGLSIVDPRRVDDVRIRVTLVPNNEQEFDIFLEEYEKHFAVKRSAALIELNRVINRLDPSIRVKFNAYKKQRSNQDEQKQIV